MSFPATAGKKPGLEIWRIEKMQPTAIPKEQFGQFYSGDCYIVMNTWEKSGALNQDLHFWLGEHSSQDERGSAAYHTVTLDDQLGGRPVQHREVQGHESPKFLSYFPNLQYLDGGVASAFRHVDPTAYQPRLFHLKGKRNVRVQQVELSAASMNEGDVFILDCGLTLYLWNGTGANKYEKFKGLEVITHIKDDERGGKAEIVVLESGKNDNDAKFWDTLGGKRAIKSADAGGSDDEVKEHVNKLLLLADDGSVSEVAQGVLERSALQTSEILIVDAGNALYAWIGRGASADKKKKVMTQASDLLHRSGRPDYTPVTRVSEGVEPSSFKQLFKQWNQPRVVDANGPREPSAEEKVDLEALRVRQQAEEKMVDDASGETKIWRIQNFEKVPLEQQLYGQFFAGDSYIVQYSYMHRNAKHFIVYFWQGRDSTADEKGASALLSVNLAEELQHHGKPVQVRVVQNKEPNHFLSMFKGRMVVHDGGVASAFKNRSDATTGDLEGVGLYHVRGTTAVNTRGVQVATSATSLNASDCYVLRTASTIYVWQGRGANEHERQVATNIGTILQGQRGLEQVPEGSEPDAFWEALGGKADYPQSKTLETGVYEPRLFHCTNNKRGHFTVDEVPNFTQDDLINDDVMLLDTYDELFVWVGNDASREEREKSIELALEYVKNAKDGRSSDTPIFKVLAGSEPMNFTCHFRGWNDEKASDFTDPYLKKLGQVQTRAPSSEHKQAAVERITEATGSFVKPGSAEFTLDQLKTRPANVDPSCREQYLNDHDFKALFGMDKAGFAALPKWKQTDAKKKHGLF